MAQNQTTPLPPQVSNQINKDLKAWEAAEERLSVDMDLIHKLLKMVETMKNPLIAARELMMAVQEYQGDKVGVLAAVDNLDSDIRSEFSDAQNSLNTAIGEAQKGGAPTKKEIAAMKAFMETLDRIEAFLKYEQALGGKGQMDGSTVKTMLDAIDSIKAQFGAPSSNPIQKLGNSLDPNWDKGKNLHGVKRWGKWTWKGDKRGEVLHYGNQQFQKAYTLGAANGTTEAEWMAQQLNNWIDSGKKNGTPSPELKIIQDSFHTMIQAASALSATTNTSLQFATSVYKQDMGVSNSLIQSYEKLIGASIRNEKTS